jgi:antagonist of KipI
MTLRVVEPGLCTVVVDFGRPHSRGLGVPVGGAADRSSLTLGNALVGNAPDAAALEINLAGPTLEAQSRVGCAVYGAPFEVSRDRQSIPVGKAFTLQAGERLRIGGCAEGARAYLCVRGGFQMRNILGSRSSLAPLISGQELPCEASDAPPRFLHHTLAWDRNWAWFEDLAGPYVMLRVLDGAQASWFGKGGFFAPADGSPAPLFTVGPSSDRMGLRLTGEPVKWPGRELVSEPVCPGSVQVTRDGQCIILGVEGQTIGGYPKIAHVISADLDRLGQLRPGDQVFFVRVGLERAEELYCKKRAELNEWVARLRVSLEGLGGL